MYDLNDLISPDVGVLLTLATDVNDVGQISGWGRTPPGGYLDVAVLLTPHPQPPGDLNDDCAVDITDFLMLLASWGPCPSRGSCPADFDTNGSVDVIDFLTLLANWG
jgi:hypothetical protein